MACYRLQLAHWFDSLSAKDALVVNPVFNIAQPLGGADDPLSLCTDLANGWNTLWSKNSQIRVRAYELPYVRGAGHVAEKVVNASVSQTSGGPRELALCLSFYGSKNAPKHRGRIYIPYPLIGLTLTGPRPTSTQMDNAAGPVNLFKGLGGVNVDWSIYSPTDNRHEPVTNWWVDNEWDVVRSRGLIPTTRTTGTTSEGDIPNRVLLQAIPETDQD